MQILFFISSLITWRNKHSRVESYKIQKKKKKQIPNLTDVLVQTNLKTPKEMIDKRSKTKPNTKKTPRFVHA